MFRLLNTTKWINNYMTKLSTSYFIDLVYNFASNDILSIKLLLLYYTILYNINIQILRNKISSKFAIFSYWYIFEHFRLHIVWKGCLSVFGFFASQFISASNKRRNLPSIPSFINPLPTGHKTPSTNIGRIKFSWSACGRHIIQQSSKHSNARYRQISAIFASCRGE